MHISDESIQFWEVFDYKNDTKDNPSVTSVFKAASYGCSFCGRVTVRCTVGFRQVFEYKSESLVIPLVLAFLHTAPCCSELATGLFSGSTFNTACSADKTAKRTVRKERLFSYGFLNDSTYVRVCQVVWEIICGLHSLGRRNCAGCKKVFCFLGGFPIAPEPLRTAIFILCIEHSLRKL